MAIPKSPKLTNSFTAIICFVIVPSVVAAVCHKSVTTTSGTFAPTSRRLCSGQVIFEENFDTFNGAIWAHNVDMAGGRNGEFQWHTNSVRNSFARYGWLHIKPTLTTDEIADLSKCKILLKNCEHACERICNGDLPAPPVQSALIRSATSFSFKYGRVLVRARLPLGDWLWPSIRMLPKLQRYGEWPRSGEIRLMDARGNQRLWLSGQNIGTEQFQATLHFGTDSTNSAWPSAHFQHNEPRGAGLHQDFHLYQMDWSPHGIAFSLDGKCIGFVETGGGYFRHGLFGGLNPWINGTRDAPFDQEFYFVFNLAVGGTNGFFPDPVNPNKKPWHNQETFPLRSFWKRKDQWLPTWNLKAMATNSTLLIDYIRVYAL